MLEGPSKDTDLIWEARLEGMAPEIDGKVYVTEFEGVNDAADLPAPGSLATIEITEAKDYDLIGRVTEFESPRATREAPAPAPTLFPILA
jgi:ribosomal protein S12 methylthiotransferase